MCFPLIEIFITDDQKDVALASVYKGLHFISNVLCHCPTICSIHQDGLHIGIKNPKFGPQEYLIRSPHRSEWKESCSSFANLHYYILFGSSINSYRASRIGKGGGILYGLLFSLIGSSFVLFIRTALVLLLLMVRPVIPKVIASD